MSANTGLNLTVVAPVVVATSVTLPSYPSLVGTVTGPLVAGTAISPIVVTPSNWAGTLTLSGAQASAYATAPNGSGGANLVVGPSGMATGATYDVVITATP